MKRLGLLLLVCGMVPACTGPKASGAYVDLLIDAMAAEAPAAEPTDNPEQAVQAVRAWRAAQDARGSTPAAAPQSAR